MIEDSFPESFKRVSFHPSKFIYAWRKGTLDKLFEELMMSNIAVSGGEVWLVKDNEIVRTIPLQKGDIREFSWEIKQREDEEWSDYVDRSAKESLEIIKGLDLEKNARLDITNKIWYNFRFKQEA